MIDIKNMTYTRSGYTILSQVDLQIPPRALTAIIGPNGAGKSTLLHCMAGLLTPQSGQIFVEGTDVHDVRETERAHLLALLTQHQNVIPRLSVAELVAFGRWPIHKGRPRNSDREVVKSTLERFDLSDMANSEVSTLSGGQRQRAYLAMACAQSTPWLLLDEPLSALDPKYSRDIMDRLRGVRDTDVGIVIVIHDLSIAARYADHVVAMKSGTVFATGRFGEDIGSNELTQLFDTPLKVDQVEDQLVVIPA